MISACECYPSRDRLRPLRHERRHARRQGPRSRGTGWSERNHLHAPGATTYERWRAACDTVYWLIGHCGGGARKGTPLYEL